MDLFFKSLQMYGRTDPRQLITFFNNELLRFPGVKTVYLDHHTFVKRIKKQHITFFFEIQNSDFKFDKNRIWGRNIGPLVSLIAFVQAIRNNYEANRSIHTNFFVTTKPMADYLDMIGYIESPLFVLGMNSSEFEVGDRIITGHYGIMKCRVVIYANIDPGPLCELLETDRYQSFLEMQPASFGLVEFHETEGTIILDFKLKFNPLHSPSNLVEKYNKTLDVMLTGLEYTVEWEKQSDPVYNINQNNHVVLQHIMSEYAEMKQYIAEEHIDSFKISQFRPCIGLGPICKNFASLDEINQLSYIYGKLIEINGGFYENKVV